MIILALSLDKRQFICSEQWQKMVQTASLLASIPGIMELNCSNARAGSLSAAEWSVAS